MIALKRLFAVLALLALQGFAPARATNYQDMWWNPSESGWGINVLHQADTLVATWFIYDTDSKPLWLLAVAGKSGGNTYAGAVYKYTGPYFGGAFDPDAVTETQVGTAQFVFADLANAQLTYVVNGTSVTKVVTRQTYAELGLDGIFYSSLHRLRTGCTDASLNNASYFVYNRAYEFRRSGTTLGVGYGAVDSANVFTMNCSATGSYTAYGSTVEFSAPFTCTNGSAGTLVLSDLRVTDSGLVGDAVWQYAADSGGCRYDDVVGGARLQYAPL